MLRTYAACKIIRKAWKSEISVTDTCFLVSVMQLLIFQLLTGMGDFLHQSPPEKNINKNKNIKFSKRELVLHNLCGKYILQCLRGNICKPNLLVVWQTESWQMSVQNSACTESVQSYTSYDTPLLPLRSLRKWWAVSKSTAQVPSHPLASGCNFRFFWLFPINACWCMWMAQVPSHWSRACEGLYSML